MRSWSGWAVVDYAGNVSGTGQSAAVDILGDSAKELYELVPDGVIVVRADGSIAHLSSRAEQMLGFGPGELIGKSVESVVPQNLRAIHQVHRDRYAGQPVARAMGSGLELVAARKDGSEIPVEVSLAPWRVNGELIIVAAIRDRSELKNIATQLHNSRERLQSLIRSVPDTAIFSADVNGVILDWNYGATLVTGLASQDAIGTNVDQLFLTAADREAFDQELKRALQDGGIAVRQGWLRRDDGARYYAEVAASSLSDEGVNTAGFAVTVRDVTTYVLGAASLASASAFNDLQSNEVGLDVQLDLLVQLVHDVLSPDFVVIRTASEDEPAPGSAGVSTSIVLAADDAVIGELVVALPEGISTFTQAEIDYLHEVARSVAHASARKQALEDRSRLATLEDHDRIARDLHDTVIQQIFAAGLRLQGASMRIADGAVRDEIGEVVDELDTCIRTLRQTIYRLEHDGAEFELRRKMLDLVAKAAMSLGFMPAVSFDFPADETVPTAIAKDALNSLTELLSNVAKHAKATRVQVSVTLGDKLIIEVTDDGIGIPAEVTIAGYGLNNLATRAHLHNGHFTWQSHPGKTHMTWSVPLT